jgi:hypothetical protein
LIKCAVTKGDGFRDFDTKGQAGPTAQKSGLKRAMIDQGWGEFRRQLDYMGWESGLLIAAPIGIKLRQEHKKPIFIGCARYFSCAPFFRAPTLSLYKL